MTRKRFRRSLPVGALALAGLLLLGHGLYLPAKAQLAQILLERAWTTAKSEGSKPPPWPWADTYPVGRLHTRATGAEISQIILSGASGRNLAFGPTHVAPSAQPGQPGHVVLSGHRDTHFGWLKELSVGDELTLEFSARDQRFLVVSQEIVDLAEGDFQLQPEGDWLSLVTCYPFDALFPNTTQRYIVHAVPIAPDGSVML